MQCVRLNQHTLLFDGLQQLPQGLNLTTSVSGVGGLGNRHVNRHRKLHHRFASLNVTGYWYRDTISYSLSRSHHFR